MTLIAIIATAIALMLLVLVLVLAAKLKYERLAWMHGRQGCEHEHQTMTLTITSLAGQVAHLTLALQSQEEENEYLRANLERIQERYDALASVMAEGVTRKEARG